MRLQLRQRLALASILPSSIVISMIIFRFNFWLSGRFKTLFNAAIFRFDSHSFVGLSAWNVQRRPVLGRLPPPSLSSPVFNESFISWFDSRLNINDSIGVLFIAMVNIVQWEWRKWRIVWLIRSLRFIRVSTIIHFGLLFTWSRCRDICLHWPLAQCHSAAQLKTT